MLQQVGSPMELYNHPLNLFVAGFLGLPPMNIFEGGSVSGDKLVLDDYLIPKADWVARRDEYLRRAQLEGFADCRATLEGLDQELDACYGQTNARFRAGDNPFLTFRANGTFHVATPKLEAVDSPSPGDFLPDKTASKKGK